MLAEIKRPVHPRRLELITLAAALELKHSPCSLAHGQALANMVGEQAVIDIATTGDSEVLTDAERAMIRFARRVAKDASQVTSGEVAALKEIHGFSDAEVFDIAAIAASRAFFTKLLDALGAEPDLNFMRLEDELRRALTVGRPISCQPPQVLDGDQAA
jgi:alkylhydroperoxidase family enzyme